MTVHHPLSRIPLRPLAGVPPTRGGRSPPGSAWSSSRWDSRWPYRRSETTDADYRMGESGRADAMVARRRARRPGRRERPDHPTRRRTAGRHRGRGGGRDVRAALSSVDGVDAVTGPQWNPDRSAVLIAVRLAADLEDPAPLVAATAEVQRDHPGLEIRQAGDLTIDEAINTRVGEDLSAAEGFSLPVTLVLMLLAFGALIAAGIPVLLAATSVIVTIGLIAPLSHLVHAEGTVSSMIVLIGMAVGVDYSLFYLKREREERARRPQHPGRGRDRGPDVGPLDPRLRAWPSSPRWPACTSSATPRSTPSPPAPSWSSRSPCSARSRCCPPCSSSSAAGSTGPGCRCSGG